MTFSPHSFVLAALAFLALGGSLRAAAPVGTIPDDIQNASVRVMEDLRHNKFDLIEQVATDASRRQDLPSILSKMAAGFPSGEPKLIRAVGYEALVGTAGQTSYFASYEYQYPELWVLLRVEWQRVDGKLRLNGINIKLMKESLEASNAFTFGGKGMTHYLILCFAVLAPLFSLYTLVLCLRAKGLKWRWLWALFIILGFGRLAFNWTTGASHFSALGLELLSVSWLRVGNGPWVISVGLPLGALVCLWKLSRLKKARAKGDPSVARA
jgi:hypothetical protein